MNETITRDGKEILSNGKTVWINGADGSCLGRFSLQGIDIHKDAEAQMKEGSQCLDCKPGPTDIVDWRRFQSSMYQFYGVVITDKHMPKYLKKK